MTKINENVLISQNDLLSELKDIFENYHDELIQAEEALAILEYLIFRCGLSLSKK